ncbi:MAG: UpxY family transcription antiterminator [Alphaproteobacteria bacterium]|uniref:UpxY family transcription antiterminator n=1 Tax=Candidatus Nitrobium versatile TaxID=2884831 RepID=A0A953JBL4_9BACT|nr:UpxY family transcription antiterminator [Candidatus Nitrobium versatile]
MTMDGMHWYALHVRSRHEFVARDELLRKGIDVYLPALRQCRQWKDRKKTVDFPLFPGYCFVHIPPRPEEFVAVLKTKGAVTLLSAKPGIPTPVPPEEILSLRILVESGTELDIYPHLREGMRVRVKRGPLKGAEGVLEKKEEQYLFTVGIELLGRSISVKVYADDIEAG